MFEERWYCDEEKTQTEILRKPEPVPEQQNTKSFKLQELRSQVLERLTTYDKEHNYYTSAQLAFSTFQNQVKQLSEEINNQSQLLLKFIEKRDQDILTLKEKIERTDILSLNTEEMDLMMNILEEENLDVNQVYGSTVLNQLVKINKTIEKCDNDLKSQSHSLSAEHYDNVQLIGPKQLSLKHGKYYYEYDDGSKEYAGQFEFNNKQGLWKEYQGFDKIHKKPKFVEKQYLNGIELGVQGASLGKFDQQRRKAGQWIEFSGNENQIIMNGQYENGAQIGEWRIFYRDNHQCGGGYFNQEGKKTGKWIELDDRYSEKYLISYTGEYSNGLRVGEWIIQEKGLKIGGGYYNENGMKVKHWTEIHENYQNQLFTSCKVTYQGSYENGIRVGQWSTFNEENKIGGGLYINGQKNGAWTELDDNYRNSFLNDCQVTYSGEYIDGLRIGYWITKDKIKIIGGGQYDRSGQKHGEWTELHENYYTSAFFNCQVRMIGKYNNGKRQGDWIIVENDSQIGGGKYDEVGNKTDLWIELHPNFESTCQVTFSGIYKNGVRQGEWIFKDQNQLIGGGNYNEQGVKTGKWVDLHSNYSAFCKITYTGEYNNGVRIGKWITFNNDSKTGYGTYDEKGQQIGTWIELYEGYEQNCKVVMKGQYQNGKKYGLWNIYENQKKIAGGEYNNQGFKTGNWIDLHENYSASHKVILNGQYINGVRYGQWQTQRLKL